jgi:mannitol-1-phosphate/altronate dehydrogenase
LPFAQADLGIRHGAGPELNKEPDRQSGGTGRTLTPNSWTQSLTATGDRLKAAGFVDLLELALAPWMRRVRGEDELGQPIHVTHPLAALLRSRAIEGGADPIPLLAISALFGELADDQPFFSTLQQRLRSLYSTGAKANAVECAAKAALLS